MCIVGNILWILFGGLIIFLEYIFAGLILCLSVIGIPPGLQCFKIGLASLAPFGKKVVPMAGTSSGLSTLLNVIWFLTGGIWIGLSHLIFGIGFCLSIIGIPFGLQHFKLMQLGFMPFGKDLR